MGRKTPPSKETIAKMKAKEKRFKPKGDPDGQVRRQDKPGGAIPWEIRKAYGTLCREQINLKSPGAVNDVLERINGKGVLPTIAQSIAAAQILKALKGDSTAAEIVTVNNEGKQPDNLNINSRGSITHRDTPLEGKKKDAAIEELLRLANKFKPQKEK